MTWNGKVPAGKWLHVTTVSHGRELQIELREPPADWPITRVPVPVPTQVTRYVAVVRTFKDQTERHEISRAALPRALRLLQGLVVEAERRGATVAIVPARTDNYGRHHWSGPEDGHFQITTAGYTAAVRVSEDGLSSRSYWEHHQSPYGPPPSSAQRRERLTEYEANATGRLCLELVGYWDSIRTARWADRRDGPLEDKLADVLYEIDIRALEQEQRREAAEREALERQHAWEIAKAGARDHYLDHRHPGLDHLGSPVRRHPRPTPNTTYRST